MCNPCFIGAFFAGFRNLDQNSQAWLWFFDLIFLILGCVVLINCKKWSFKNLAFTLIILVVSLIMVESGLHLIKWVNSLFSEKIIDHKLSLTPYKDKEWAKSAYYVYTLQIKKRDKFVKYFNEKKIATGIYYPIPVHRQPIIEKLYGKQPKLPITEELVKKIVSIPLSPQLSNSELERIKIQLNNFMEI